MHLVKQINPEDYLIAEKNIVSTTDIALCMILNAYLRQLIIFEQ